MKIKLTKEEQKKLQAVGLVNVGRKIEVEESVFQKNYAEWKKTLPLAGHSTLTLKAISTCLWTKRSGEHRQDFVLPSNQPKQEIKVKAVFPRWELRIIIGLLVLILGCLLFALPARAQFSQLTYIEWKDGGSAVNNGFFTYGFTVDCTTNLTCTSDGSTLTLSAAGSSGAPSTLEYLVLTLDAGLSAERQFTAGVGIGSTDGGANGAFDVTLDLGELTANQTFWTGASASRTITFSLSGGTDPVLTLADGAFNLTTGTLQQGGDDVIHKNTNTLLSTENLILDGSANPRDITLGILRILQTPNIDSTRGIAIITDAAGFGDTKSIEIDWTATDVAAGDFEAVIDIDIDTANSTGGNIIALEITATDTGSATPYGMLTGVGVNPLLNEAGSFGNVEIAFVSVPGFTDVTTAFNSTGTDVQMFVANGDLVYIGMAALFDEVEFILAIVATNAGIKPTFEYSDGASGWITFSPTDNTNGMRQNGDLVWIASALAGWAQDTVNSISGKFWIRITRTAVTVSTPPTEDLVQVNSDVDYVWDSGGNLNVASVSSGFNAEIADAGFIRCTNNQACMAWELATPGTDKTLIVDSSDILQFNGTFNATTLTEGGTAVITTPVAAGEYGAASIDGDDLNSNLGGAGITLTAASPDTLDCDAASTTAVGCPEMAIASEVNTGTSTILAVTPDALAGSTFGQVEVQMVAFDFTTAVATGDGKFYFHIHTGSKLIGMNLIDVIGAVITVSSSGAITVDVARCAPVATGNPCAGTVADALSTNLTIDADEDSSNTAATPSVVDTSLDDVIVDQMWRIDVDGAGTGTKGLIVTLIFQLP